MESHLRIILLIVAALIVAFILLESWHRRRQAKKVQFVLSSQSQMSIDPDQVLGLDSREPVVTVRSMNMTDRMTETHYIRPNSASRHNVEYANKVYPRAQDSGVKVGSPDPSAVLNDLLVISVVAQPDMQFGSYDLLQAISTTGMQFGDMNIFHYKIGDEVLFSLSSMDEPGDFNLDRMGEFFCSGLTLFTDLRKVSNPKKVFELMLSVTEQLAEDLGGELRAGTRRPWNDEAYQAYHNKVMQYQLMKFT